jgi:hypothetical protein
MVSGLKVVLLSYFSCTERMMYFRILYPRPWPSVKMVWPIYVLVPALNVLNFDLPSYAFPLNFCHAEVKSKSKGRINPVLNKAPHHRNVWGVEV